MVGAGTGFSTRSGCAMTLQADRGIMIVPANAGSAPTALPDFNPPFLPFSRGLKPMESTVES